MICTSVACDANALDRGKCKIVRCLADEYVKPKSGHSAVYKLAQGIQRPASVMSFPGSWTSSLQSSSSGSLNEQKGRTTVEQVVHDMEELDIRCLNLLVMEQPLRASGSHRVIGQMKNTSGVILKHDYILLQVDDGKYIKAEKGGESARGLAGIYVILVDLKDPKDLKGMDGSSIRFETKVIHLGKGKVKWILKPMIKLLTDRNPNYHILAANCWKCSFSSAKAILRWSMDNALSPEVEIALETKLEELSVLERPKPDEVFQALVDPSASKSVTTRRT